MDITEQEIIKEQLIDSKNSTELMSKNRFSLLAKSSHEIRTPLNGILGAVDILKLKELNPEQLRWIEMIEKSSSSLLNIINDILDFSKIDAGKLSLSLEPFSFEEIINDVQDLFAPECAKENIKIIKRNLEFLDNFFNEYSEFFSWIRPKAGTVCFPRLLDTKTTRTWGLGLGSYTFCEKIRKDAGILLLPSDVYDYGDKHFRIGFGRKNMPEVLSKFEDYLDKIL